MAGLTKENLTESGDCKILFANFLASKALTGQPLNEPCMYPDRATCGGCPAANGKEVLNNISSLMTKLATSR